MTSGKKQAFEPTGLIPRSIIRTFDRFYKQLLPKTKYSAIREYRISRYQVLVSIRCLCTLVILPLITRIISNWLIFPQIQYFWDVTYQDEHVFSEVDQFSQVLFFDSLLEPHLAGANTPSLNIKGQLTTAKVLPKEKTILTFTPSFASSASPFVPTTLFTPTFFVPFASCPFTVGSASSSSSSSSSSAEGSVKMQEMHYCSFTEGDKGGSASSLPVTFFATLGHERDTQAKEKLSSVKEKESSVEEPDTLPFLVEHRSITKTKEGISSKPLVQQDEYQTLQDKALQEKIFELAEASHLHALQSLANVFADFSSILVFIFLLITLKPEITILKSFLIEVIYNLSDTTKSFLLILMTDLLVGFHSPRGWETMFSLVLHHFGLPENQDFVFLFVATLPVILDTVFKYWIFRHLNKISPSTVATYHNMIE